MKNITSIRKLETIRKDFVANVSHELKTPLASIIGYAETLAIAKEEKDKSLILDLLKWMHEKKTDYTNTFCHLMGLEPEKNRIYEDMEFLNWKLRWKERLKNFNNSPKKYEKLMRSYNPLVIPRNHKVEEALSDAEKNNYKTLNILLSVIQNPYDPRVDILKFQTPAPASKEKYQTFCGT